MKKIIFLFILIIILVFTIFLVTKKNTNDYPVLILKGNNIVNIKMNENYVEPGYRASDTKDGDITDKVTITNNINYNQPGTYEIIYKVTNSNNRSIEMKRFVNISLMEKIIYKDEYDLIDNTKKNWGTKNKKDGTRSIGDVPSEELKKYNAYYIGSDEKTIYLTFDEGNNKTYLAEIVEILNKKNVKATFFFCKNYILSNPNLMNILVQNGHSVGNHTANHYEMPDYANKVNYQKYINEIRQLEDAFKQVTNQNIDKIYREPKGIWSYRSLEIMKQLGYKTYFWSAAYVDFGKVLSKDEAYNALLSRIHNGAIYLIHPTNKGNYEAIGDFIDKVKELGYQFDLVKNIN